MEQAKQVPRYWFPAKRCGWGWGLPITWQGWAVFLAYLATLSILPFGSWWHTQPLIGFIGIAALAVLLVAICWFKGEPPRWRWGKQ